MTQVYDRDDPHVATDPQFGATEALCLHWRLHDEPRPRHANIEPHWYELSHTLVLAPGQPHWPRAPIR